jgi:peptidyl-prolyl cis-trans isomerase C
MMKTLNKKIQFMWAYQKLIHCSVSMSFMVYMLFPSISIAADLSGLESVAKVNGVEISKSIYEMVLNSYLSQGATDGEELRKKIKQELILREVISQEARKQKLDKEEAVRNQIVFQEKGLLSEVLLAKELSSIKITEDQLQAEYKRQNNLLSAQEQFQVSHILLASESEALQILKEAKSGESFSKIATNKSLDRSRQSGGNLGWLLSNQLIAPISNVIVNLSPGQIAATPIQTSQGWHVVKLDAKRKYQAPAFEDVKFQLIQAVQMNQRSNYVEKLLKTSKIEE